MELDSKRRITKGSPELLRRAVRNAADLRIYTEFRHNEHIDPTSANPEIIREVSDFPATYLIDERWVAANMTLRQPVTLPDRFGERASMSFFLYNEDGTQAIARPFLDGKGYISPVSDGHGCDESKYHESGVWDSATNAPSSNFVYDFDCFRFLADDGWQEVYANDRDGNPVYGKASLLDEASNDGCEIKVAVSGICEGLWGHTELLKHELFIQTGPHYYYSETGYMVAETRPFVRILPSVPMAYSSNNWDFGWAIVRSDGHVAGMYFDPYTLKDQRTFSKHAIRWFVR